MQLKSWMLAASWMWIAVLPIPADSSTFEYEFREYDGSNLRCSLVVADAASDSVPVTGSLTTQRPPDIVGWGSASFEAIAERGIVGSRIASSVFANTGYNLTYGGCSVVRTVIDDISVSGPAGSVTADLTVSILGESTGDSPRSPTPVSFRVTLTARAPGGAIRDTSAGSLAPAAPGMVDTTLSSGTISIQSGDTLTAELEIVTDNSLTGTPDTKAADLDFADESLLVGMSFSRTGPILTLPPGYTADSTDGEIVDNEWQLGVVEVPALGLPAFLLLGGLLAAAGSYRSRAS